MIGMELWATLGLGKNEIWCNNHNIIRLPALVGEGLKKNALFDIKNNNNVDLIDSRNSYQFYPLKNLWKDIKKTLELKKKLCI